jgi:hypothetical protein
VRGGSGAQYAHATSCLLGVEPAQITHNPLAVRIQVDLAVLASYLRIEERGLKVGRRPS